MKKIIILILSLCVAIFALAACVPKEELSSESPEETFPEQNEQSAERPNEKETEMIDTIYLTIGSHKIAVKLENNTATKALVELLKEGDITYTASDYGGFEKVGSLGHTLPHSDTQIATEAGDVILYLGNQIVLFYGSNSWNYTRLGKMQGYSADELKDILTETDPVTIKICLR